MRVGFFTDSYKPYTSGVVRSIETVTRQLEARNHQVFIFAPAYPGFKEDTGGVYRFPSIQSPTNRDFYLAMPFSAHLKSRLKKLDLDIVHVHSPFMLGGLGARMARRLSVPLVYTYHTMYDHYTHYVPIGQVTASRATLKFCVTFCNNCDLVLVPTGVVAGYLRQAGVRTAIECLPTGIAVNPSGDGDRLYLRERFRIDPEVPVCLFVGRLGREKNLEFLLRSFALVSAARPDAVLVLIGGGPEEEAIRKMTGQMGLEDRVIFTGLLAYEDVGRCYAGADVFVFPSLTETQGLVIGEAKAAGLPVVAVRAFATAEMVTGGGVDGFLTAAVESEFARSVLHVLDDDVLRRAMGQRSRESAGHLDATTLAARLVATYRRLIGES
ncbi:MAG: glycosyltransferase [Peptococcaceae bacterium]|jgi:glycosyltransferase involved in cell wall biosynthesis|nr:glycosyltransferase [Peptococcaceae bacterium]